MDDIRDLLKEILEELRIKNNRPERNPNDLLTAKEVSEQYNMNYVKVLQQFKDKRMKVYTGTKEYRVFRQDYEDYLREA